MQWVEENCDLSRGAYEEIEISIEELAFRQRKEGLGCSYWQEALLDVHQEVEGPQDRKQDYGFWFLRAKPIHWILAALLAKGDE